MTDLAGIGVQIRRGAMWSALNTIVMKFANIAITAVVIRIVTPREFGVFAVAATLYAVVSSFGELGLSSCLARADLDPDAVAPTVVSVAMLSSVVLAGGMALAAGPFAAALGAPDADSAIRVLSLSVLLGGVFTAPAALLVRDFRQGWLFASTIVAFVPANVSLVLIAWHGNGAMAFAWSRVIGQIFAGAVMVWAVKKRYRPGLDRARLGMILRFGLPLAGANLLNYTLLNADYAFIGHTLGPALLGLYMLAFNVASWATSALAATINSVAMPAFSRVGADPELLRGLLGKAARIVCLLAFPISAMTLVLADPLIRSLYGPKWVDAGPVLAILSVYGAAFVLSLLLANILVGIGRSGRLFALQGVWVLVLVPTMAVGLTVAGLRGVAAAHIVVILIVVLPAYAAVLSRIVPGVSAVLLRAAVPPLLAAVAAAAAAALASMPIDPPVGKLVVGGTVGGVVYTVAVLGMVREFLPARVIKRLAPMSARRDQVLGRQSVRAAVPAATFDGGAPKA
jgi:lipopolysaccharide exporter